MGLAQYLGQTFGFAWSKLTDTILYIPMGLIEGLRGQAPLLERWVDKTAKREAIAPLYNIPNAAGIDKDEKAFNALSALVYDTSWIDIHRMLGIESDKKGPEKKGPVLAVIATMSAAMAAPAAIKGILDDMILIRARRFTKKTFRPEQLDISTAQTAQWRNIISKPQLKEIIAKNGYDDKDVNTIIKTHEYLPGPADLINIAVKEGFMPQEALRIHAEGYNVPEKFIEYARMQGMSEEWCERFWHAHWRLIAPSQLFEMFHRGIIKDEETLIEYLKWHDYYADDATRILALSYNLVTRVDARRLFQVGEWDEHELQAHYQKLGYTEKDAKSMVVWAQKEFKTQERDITKGEILKGGKQGLIERVDCITMLQNIGYDEQEATFLYELTIYTAIQDETLEWLTIYRKMLASGVITEQQALSEMAHLEISLEAQRKVIAQSQLDKAKKIATLSRTMIVKALKKELLSKDDALLRLSYIGYPETDAKIILGMEGFTFDEPKEPIV